MRFSVGDLYLDINQEAGTIECQSTTFEEAGIVSQIAVQCQSNSEQIDLISQPWSINQVNMDQPSTPVGNLVGATIELNTNLQGVVVILRVGLSQDIAMAFIQLEVRNGTDLPLSVENLTLLEVQSGKIRLGGQRVSNPAFFSNGWQSWSTTGTYRKGDQQRSSILGPFQNIMVTNAGTPTTKGQDHFTSDMFTVIGDRSNQVGLLAGFLSQKEQFGSLETRFGPEPSLKMWANGDHTCLMPGCTMKTDWGVIQFIDLNHTEPMNMYFQTVAQAHKFLLFQDHPSDGVPGITFMKI